MGSFPKNFYWGAATSAHQVEGGNRNDWSEWERETAKRKAQKATLRQAQGKGWPDYILQNYPSPLQEENYISGRACDHYNRFREDFDIAKSLGHNAHRFSIEWSRIEPEEGRFDEKEIEHYRKVILALKERGMEPLVTLWHYTLPLWVERQGGWVASKTIRHFIRFCERVVHAFKNEVKFWITLNEPSLWSGQAYLLGIFPPQKRNLMFVTRAYFNLVRAQRDAYRRIKTIAPHCHIGITENFEWSAGKALRPIVHYLHNFLFLDRVRHNLDFIGINYYMMKRIGAPPQQDTSDEGWEIYPQGLYAFLKTAAQRYHKPLFVSENGLADAQDTKRADFITSHIGEMRKVIEEGIDVRGYFCWSLLDTFEWDRGFWPRFGLVEIDYRTLDRKIRPSARVYSQLIANSR